MSRTNVLKGIDLMIDLNGKTALVTGGCKGIGKGIAMALANAGANVIVTYRTAGSEMDVVNYIKLSGKKSTAIKLDITNIDSIKECLEIAFNFHPVIDILVNNAGIYQNNTGQSATEDDFDICYKVNLRGVWSISKAFVPHFRKRNSGKIINIASAAGRRGHSSNAYCASKAGVISLTQSLATELGPYNINVNAICPGTVWTSLYERVELVGEGDCKTDFLDKRKAFNHCIKNTPLGRPQNPEDIGFATVFLVSGLAKNITGQTINVDGGLLMN